MNKIVEFLPIVIFLYLILQYFLTLSKIFNDNYLTKNEKFKWMLIIIFMPILGTILFWNFKKNSQ